IRWCCRLGGRTGVRRPGRHPAAPRAVSDAARRRCLAGATGERVESVPGSGRHPPGGGGRGARGGRSGRRALTDSRLALSDVPSIFPSSQATGGSHMRKCIGSALLLVMLAAYPALGAAQRRTTRSAPARSTQRTSFGLQLDVGTKTDFGIGGRAVFGLASLFPGTPLDGIVSFDYYFPSHPSGPSKHCWEINGNTASRFR